MKQSNIYSDEILNEIKKLKAEISKLKRSAIKHQQTEEALKESEEKFRILFESSRDAIMTLSPPSWRFTAGNQATIEMFNAKDEEEFISKEPWELSPEYQPDGQLSSDKAKKMIEKAMETGSNFFEWTHNRIKGENFAATVLLTRIELKDIQLLQATVRDISQRKMIEAELIKHQQQLEKLVDERTRELKENEMKFRAFTNQAIEGITVTDLEGNYVFVNPAFCKMSGYTRRELLKMTFFDMKAEGQSHSGFYESIREMEGKPILLKLKRKDKSEYETEIVSKVITIGREKQILGTIRDITERKKAERALKTSEYNLRSLFSLMNEIVLELDKDGKYLYIAPTSPDLLYKPAAQLLGKTLHEVFPQTEADKFLELIRRSLQKNSIVEMEYPLQMKDNTIWFECRITPKTENSVLYIARDITERKLVKEALKESEKKYRRIFEEFQDLYYKTNLEGILKDISPSVKRLTGFEPEEVIGKPVSRIYKNKSDQLRFVRMLKKQGKVEDYELILYGKNQREIISSATSHFTYDENNQINGVEGVLRDITQRKIMEIKLQQNEKMLRQIIDTTPNCIFVKDRNGKYLVVNKRMGDLHRVKPETMVGKYDYQIAEKWFESIEYKAFRTSEKKVIDTGEPLLIEKEKFQYSDGRELWFQTVKMPFEFNENENCLLVISTDITESVNSQAAIQLSEEKYRTLTENLNVGVYRTTSGVKGKFIEVNQAFMKIFGFSDKQQILDMHVIDLYVNPAEREVLNRLLIEQGTVNNWEVKLKRTDETVIDCSVSVTAVQQSDQEVYFDGVIVDITERLKAENALRESEKKFSSIVEASPMGMILLNLNQAGELILIDSNPAASLILRVDKADYIGKALEEALPALSSSMLPQIFKQVAREGTSWKLDEKEYHDDKIKGYFDLHAFQISPGNMVVMFMDVTERKKMMQAIKSSEKRLKILFESAPDAIFLYNSKGIFLDGNKTAEEYVGYNKAELIGKSFLKLNLVKLKDLPRVVKVLKNNALGMGTEPNELELHRKDGSTIVLEVRAYPVVIDNKTVFLGIARDMTERKKIETKIKLNLEEKETLLRELYHRTKNNMQIISAMLSLQSRRSESDYIDSSFKEIINKINAMSMVHEKLYHSKDLSRINLKDYLQDLLALLIKSFGFDAGKITWRFELDDVFLTIDTAIPLGLVINELITNAFRHAFKNNNNCELFITLKRNKKGTVKLLIGDNGTGIPVDMDLRKSGSMGLQTVFALIEYQIKGKISYQNKNGLQWYIEFKDSYTKRV